MFHTKIITIYGEKGKAWLDRLPQHVGAIASSMGLRDLSPVLDLSYNYVLSGFQGDTPIILKLVYDHDALKREAYVLRCFEEHGGIKTLATEDGALLLRRAIPGTSLKNYFPDQDFRTIEVTCDLIKKLHGAPIPKSHSLPHIHDELSVLDKDWDIPLAHLQKARMLREQLLKSSGPDVLLHGDLHHSNILQDGDEWIVIDPKGVIGDPSYEPAAFIRNPMPELLNHTDAQEIIQNRIKMFSEVLGLPERQIIDWCFVQAVLSWIWAIEDGCDAGYFKQISIIFDKITRDV